jgi:pimeloyl-ACP methyl ester carboxylesterase
MLPTWLGIKSPVVLVGHSYGGSVISEVANGNENVKALVYVSEFAPEAGETAVALSGKTSNFSRCSRRSLSTGSVCSLLGDGSEYPGKDQVVESPATTWLRRFVGPAGAK